MPSGRPLSTFTAALFDVDGTLMDSLPTIVPGLADMFEEFNGFRPEDTTIRALIGKPLPEQVTLYETQPISDTEIARRIDFAISRFEHHQDAERPFDGAVETLRFLADRGVKIALVTSKTRRELDDFLARFSAASCVHAAVSSSDVKNPKPAPDSAMLACEYLAVSAHDAVMIGDSIFDVRCAKSAGVSSVAVSYGAASQATLLAEAPDVLIETPEALLAWAQNAFLEPTCPERSLTRP